MHYYQLHHVLKQLFEASGSSKKSEDLGITISHYTFNSLEGRYFLPGSNRLFCDHHQVGFKESSLKQYASLSDIESTDFSIECNNSFHYHIVQDIRQTQAEGAVIMFHGLNEKKWDKYLPWAYEIAKRTKKAVLLFPIAFHMDRAPELWSSRNEMYFASQNRTDIFPDNTDSSYVNAAISTRLESNPQRIFWSGLQTYYDVIRLVYEIRKGTVPEISKHASFDLFGYSMGSFLSMILMMANPKNIFSEAKLFCFCGGMTIDRMYPISKYIMDSRAAIAMQTSFTELLNTNFKNDERLAHYQNSEHHKNESWFKTMLRYNFFQKEREERLKELQRQIKSFVLKQDRVTPPIEALNTLKGGYRDINVSVQIEDFEHPYSHMVPFPLTSRNAEQVDVSFNKFISAASQFLMD